MKIDDKLHVMLDLETMGVAHNAAIVSIGAVRFSPLSGEIASRFKRNITLESCAEVGLKMDPGTIMWWMRQGDNARKNLEGGEPLSHVLSDFTKWMNDAVLGGVWGNGAEFDNVILTSAYTAFGLKAPWKYALNRCYRTVKALSGISLPDMQGVKHDALDDAEHQARCLSLIFRDYARQRELGI